MTGIHAATAAPLDELADIRQSIATILTTPLGSRVMRRDFGSLLCDLIDSPATARGCLRLIAAAADAIARWEPRVKFLKASVTPGGDGRAVLSADFRLRATGGVFAVTVAL